MKLDRSISGVCENFEDTYLEEMMGITKKTQQLQELKQKWMKL
jgi:hypothetical protein